MGCYLRPIRAPIAVYGPHSNTIPLKRYQRRDNVETGGTGDIRFAPFVRLTVCIDLTYLVFVDLGRWVVVKIQAHLPLLAAVAEGNPRDDHRHIALLR